MLAKFLPLLIGAYLFGSIPTAYLVAKWRRGIDIRQYGSGNVGASNVMAVVSKKWSIPVTLFDIGKGLLSVWAARLLGLDVASQAVVGLAAIAGHNWSAYLHFSGGRGIFASLGVIAMLSPGAGLIVLVIAYSFAPFKQLPLGVTIALAVLPLISWFFGRQLSIIDPLAVSLGYTAIFLIAMVKRLVAPKTALTDTVSRGELIINRLLYDRDIKDRKAWLSQTPRR